MLSFGSPASKKVVYTFRPGYLKALEHGNSVTRPKGFCEADKVNFLPVCFVAKSKISQFTPNLIFYENILSISNFGEL